MPLLQLSSVSLAYGHVPLLDHADLVLEAGERVGLIGRNGTGKSSLLRVVEGVAAPDDGRVWLSPGAKVASVAQEPAFTAGQSVLEARVVERADAAALEAEDGWKLQTLDRHDDRAARARSRGARSRRSPAA